MGEFFCLCREGLVCLVWGFGVFVVCVGLVVCWDLDFLVSWFFVGWFFSVFVCFGFVVYVWSVCCLLVVFGCFWLKLVLFGCVVGGFFVFWAVGFCCFFVFWVGVWLFVLVGLVVWVCVVFGVIFFGSGVWVFGLLVFCLLGWGGFVWFVACRFFGFDVFGCGFVLAFWLGVLWLAFLVGVCCVWFVGFWGCFVFLLLVWLLFCDVLWFLSGSVWVCFFWCGIVMWLVLGFGLGFVGGFWLLVLGCCFMFECGGGVCGVRSCWLVLCCFVVLIGFGLGLWWLWLWVGFGFWVLVVAFVTCCWVWRVGGGLVGRLVFWRVVWLFAFWVVCCLVVVVGFVLSCVFSDVVLLCFGW